MFIDKENGYLNNITIPGGYRYFSLLIFCLIALAVINPCFAQIKPEPGPMRGAEWHLEIMPDGKTPEEAVPVGETVDGDIRFELTESKGARIMRSLRENWSGMETT